MELKNKSMHTYIKLKVTNVAVYVNKQCLVPGKLFSKTVHVTCNRDVRLTVKIG